MTNLKLRVITLFLMTAMLPSLFANPLSSGPSKEIVSFDPVFSKQDKKVKMRFINWDLNEVYIVVLDSKNREVYRENLKGEFSILKVFNFDSAYSDTYRIRVYDNGLQFEEEFTVL